MKKILLLFIAFVFISCSKEDEPAPPELPYSLLEYTEEEKIATLTKKIESLYIPIDFGISEEELREEIKDKGFVMPDPVFWNFPGGRYYASGFTSAPEPSYPIDSYRFHIRVDEIEGYNKDFGVWQPMVLQYFFYEETTERDKPYFQTQVMFTKVNDDTYNLVKDWAKKYISEDFTSVNDLKYVKERSEGEIIVEIGEGEIPGIGTHNIFVRFYDTRIPYYVR